MGTRLAAYRVCSATVFVALSCGTTVPVVAQNLHAHTPSVSGMPQGVPFFCSNPTVTSAGNGAWSDARTWSTRRVPGANDKVVIAAGHHVTYDSVSDSRLDCIEVRGHLAFSHEKDSRVKVGTVMVLEEGHLEIGSSARAIAPNVTVELVVADQPINTDVDPGQVGTGIIALGRVTMHGAVKTPTFVRVRREPLAGETTLDLEQPVAGWKGGDYVVIPDTRQLRASERETGFSSQTERVQIVSMSGAQATLAAPLRFAHRGARDAAGTLKFLPHVGNLSRNVIVRSENPRGTRGHTMFISHADIDLRYVEFRDLGRTRMGALNNTRFASDNQPLKMGTNQIGRYAVHFHHHSGPKTTPGNGYQFTLVGNAVSDAAKWGMTIHRSHYGLIQDNVVYGTRGAGIVTEDGSESFNVFDHNFSIQSAGNQSPVDSGYGGSALDLGGEGAAFWFRGPNNYIRNNVGANGQKSGFALSTAALGTVRIPAFKGADTSRAAESVQFDTSNASVLEFANNEAYGTTQTGLAWVWNGTVSTFAAWHLSQHGFSGIPPEKLIVDKLTVLGDPSMLALPSEKPVGVLIANYISRSVTVTNADIQGMRVGVSSPFFYNQTPEPGRSGGSVVIENSHFRNQIGVNVATGYVTGNTAAPVKSAVVRNSAFESLDSRAAETWPSESISMNYGMTPRDPKPRAPVHVYDYNKQPGNDFRVYYSYQAPEAAAPCHNAIPGIGGWVCK